MSEAVKMEHDLIAGFADETFQRALHAGWHATADQIERLKWKQEVCLQVQGPIISQYGFEPSRRGVAECTQGFGAFGADREIMHLNDVLSWLVDPDLQAQHPGGPVPMIPGANYSNIGKRGSAKGSTPKDGLGAELVGSWICSSNEFFQRLIISVTEWGELRLDVWLPGLWRPAYGLLKRVDKWFEVELRMLCHGSNGTLGLAFSEEHGVLVCNMKAPGQDGWSPQWIAYQAGGHQVRVTQLDDDRAIAGVARCQGALAGAHQALYKPRCPELEQQQWFGVLGFRHGIVDALESGILILHAEATNTGEIVGYISCSCTYGDANGDTRNGRVEECPHAQIHHITVLPEHRGRGVGRMLFNELLCHLREASPSVMGDLRICVVELNKDVIKWYQRLGFVEVEDWVVYPNNYPIKFINMQLKEGLEAQESGTVE